MPAPRRLFRLFGMPAYTTLLASIVAAGDDSASVRLERQVKGAFHQVAPAVVRIALTSAVDANSYSGVIVTPDGYILTRLSGRSDSSITMHMADGRKEQGTHMGYSDEWGLGVAKLAHPGPWPYAKLENDGAAHQNEVCIALTYARRSDGAFDRAPTLRLGVVTASAEPQWFETSFAFRMDEFGAPAFDLNGRLLGVVTGMPGRAHGDPVYTSIQVAREFWQPLAAGTLLDAARFPLKDRPSDNAPPHDGPHPSLERATALGTAASVRIVSMRPTGPGNPAGSSRWSGAIVRADGFIVTCAHTHQVLGDKVTIELSDGRRVRGVVLGTNRVSDVGLVKIIDAGSWPHVELGSSAGLQTGDECVVAGYPAAGPRKNDRLPLVQTVAVVRPRLGYDPYYLFLSHKQEIWGGMSGGGILDSSGRLVAVNASAGGPRIEVVEKQWESLAHAKPVAPEPANPLAAVAGEFGRRSSASAQVVVEILKQGKRCTLGTIVRSDGLVVAKASEFDGKIVCRLPDRSTRPATLVRISREHDLALLQLEQAALEAADWGESTPPEVGDVVAALMPDESPRLGVVSQGVRFISAEPTWLAEEHHKTPNGSRRSSALRVRPGGPALDEYDEILRVENRAVKDSHELRALFDGRRQRPLAYVGDPLDFHIRRNGRELDLRLRVPPGKKSWELPGEVWDSLRRSGFPAVFEADVALAKDCCGGPVVDRAGKVVGIAIASMKQGNWPGERSRAQGGTYVIPSAEVKKFIAAAGS